MNRYFKKFWRQYYLGVVCFLVIMIGMAGWFVWQNGLRNKNRMPLENKEVISSESKEKLNNNLNRRAIDGLFIEEGQKQPPIAAVVIENMIEAQPLSGIDKASLVFEAITEANITRFLAFYSLDNLKDDFKIGPIRSARPYFLDWASEFQALFGHVGGSPEANQLLKKTELIYDLDQWFESQYFERVNFKPRPHNVYTSFSLLKTAAERFLKKEQNFESWRFKDDEIKEKRGWVERIYIGYSKPYDCYWIYDRENNVYVRHQWGGEERTAEGELIKAKNIVVIWLPMKVVDEVGRKWFGTIGQGKAVVFRDGEVVEGIWRKSTPQERIKFFETTGKEIEFNAGLTWIEVLPIGYNVEW
jgi:hypothetical protein